MKALVIGYGSIGRRHAEILQNLDAISRVTVLSTQGDIPFEKISSLNDIPSLNPHYVVIASKTSMHYDQLCFLEDNMKGKTIFIEKPLFDSYKDMSIHNNKIFVGYNLRFHPVMQLVKEKVADRKLWHIHIFCGSYLPEWRPGRDYRETYSAKKYSGGGVLLDLSHELDYVQWLGGNIKPKYVYSHKVSDLEIETDDILVFDGEFVTGASIHLSLNYFTREPRRQIVIDGKGISIQADLIARTATVHQDGEKFEYDWPGLERNATYKAEHEAILSGDTHDACTYAEGLETMHLIDIIRKWSN
jgi:CMP-N,N'-diacetyllegionaminic acid synthase